MTERRESPGVIRARERQHETKKNRAPDIGGGPAGQARQRTQGTVNEAQAEALKALEEQERQQYAPPQPPPSPPPPAPKPKPVGGARANSDHID